MTAKKEEKNLNIVAHGSKKKEKRESIFAHDSKKRKKEEVRPFLVVTTTNMRKRMDTDFARPQQM